MCPHFKGATVAVTLKRVDTRRKDTWSRHLRRPQAKSRQKYQTITKKQSFIDILLGLDMLFRFLRFLRFLPTRHTEGSASKGLKPAQDSIETREIPWDMNCEHSVNLAISSSKIRKTMINEDQLSYRCSWSCGVPWDERVERVERQKGDLSKAGGNLWHEGSKIVKRKKMKHDETMQNWLKLLQCI